MAYIVAYVATIVKEKVAYRANDGVKSAGLGLRMPRPPRASQRFHYIPEWAIRRGVTQADLARELNTEKSTVTRWFQGTIPNEQYLVALAGFFGLDEPASLFRHPDHDWMTELFRGRSRQELERMRDTLKAAFPRAAKV